LVAFLTGDHGPPIHGGEIAGYAVQPTTQRLFFTADLAKHFPEIYSRTMSNWDEILGTSFSSALLSNCEWVVVEGMASEKGEAEIFRTRCHVEAERFAERRRSQILEEREANGSATTPPRWVKVQIAR